MDNNKFYRFFDPKSKIIVYKNFYFIGSHLFQLIFEKYYYKIIKLKPVDLEINFFDKKLFIFYHRKIYYKFVSVFIFVDD